MSLEFLNFLNILKLDFYLPNGINVKILMDTPSKNNCHGFREWLKTIQIEGALTTNTSHKCFKVHTCAWLIKNEANYGL